MGVQDGTYKTTNGYTFEVIDGQWFRKTLMGRQVINVQQSFSESQGYIYQLGGTWYRFNNGRLYPTINIVPSTTTTTYVETAVNYYNYGYASNGIYTINGAQYEIFMDGGSPIWSRFNLDGTSNNVNIEDKFYQNEWYYNIEGDWFRFTNMQFIPVVAPWDQQTVYAPSTTTYVFKDPRVEDTVVEFEQQVTPSITTTYSNANQFTAGSTSKYLPNEPAKRSFFGWRG